MSASVVRLPTDRAIQEAWEDYKNLAQAWADSPGLRTDLGHCQAVAEAWADWRDLFLAKRGK